MDPSNLLASLAEDFPLILSLDVASFSSCDPNDLSIALNYAFSVLPNSPPYSTVEFALDQVKVGFYQFVGWVKSTASSEIIKETWFPALARLSESILGFLHSALQPIPNSALIDQLNTILQSIEGLYNPSDAIIVSLHSDHRYQQSPIRPHSHERLSKGSASTVRGCGTDRKGWEGDRGAGGEVARSRDGVDEAGDPGK